MATPSNPRLREKNFLKAQLAGEAGRHDHTVRFMMEIVKSVTPWAELSPSERKFLCIALTKFLDDHREAWNEVNSKTLNWVGVESKVAEFYLNKISEEILNACREIKLLINRRLMLSARSAEARVFYLTFKGDMCCYIAELDGDEGEEMAAIFAYKEAKAMAKAELTWLSPARLMLALHMAEFYSEIRESPEKGVRVASKALKKAREAGSFTTGGGFSKEITELLSKLNEHIAMWTNSEDPSKEAGTSTSETQLAGTSTFQTQLAGTSQTQVISPSETNEEISEEARISGTQAALQPKPAGKEAGTSRTQAAPRPEPDCEEVGTNETRAVSPTDPGEETGTS